MDWFVRRSRRVSLFWLALGVSVGVSMPIVPTLTVPRAAHLHMSLLGFVTM